MATQEEKQELIDTLKFTPRTYNVAMYGYGGEVVMGKVPRRAYDYFKDQKIDLEEYAFDWDNETGVPQELQPFYPGQWHDCDNMCHESGVEMSSSCTIEVYDENNNEIWSHNLDAGELDEEGFEVIESQEVYASMQEDGECVFYGQQFEKGTFFQGELELTAPFDPKQLKFYYSDIEGWPVCGGLEYKENDIEGCDGYDTVGKSSAYYLWLVDDGELIQHDE